MAASGLFGLAGLFFGGDFSIPPEPTTPPPVELPPAPIVYITVRAVRCVHPTPPQAQRVNRVFLV